MWPMEKIRGTMQSIDQQLKENRNRVSALEQAAADQQLRTEVVLNQLRQEKAHLKDCWQNEQEKNNMLEAMLRDQTARMEELKKSLHQVKNELNLQVQEAQSSRQKIAAELEQVQSELTRQYEDVYKRQFPGCALGEGKRMICNDIAFVNTAEKRIPHDQFPLKFVRKRGDMGGNVRVCRRNFLDYGSVL